MIIPCKECLLIPICRYKHFIDMRVNCKLITDYLLDEHGHKVHGYEDRIKEINDTIFPSKWSYIKPTKKELLNVDEKSHSIYMIQVKNNGHTL